MKIFFCDNRLGGLLGFRRDIIRHFVSDGHEVTIIAPAPLTDWDKVGMDVEGCNIINIQMSAHGNSVIDDAKLFISYLRIYWKSRPDIVFNYTIKPNIYSSIAAKLCGAKVICMMAGLGYVFFGHSITHKLGRALYKLGLRFADKVFLLNQMNYDLVTSKNFIPVSKAVLLRGGEGLNLSEYAYREMTFTKPCTFLMISRVMYDKGYSEFVGAAEIIKRQYPEVSFELLGPLDSSPTMVPEDVIRKDEANGIIKYLGVSNDVPGFIGRDNVVIVLPSNYGEGLNRSLMEACSIGRAVITTTIPGCKEIVEDGINGYLVPPKNIQALAEAMNKYLSLSVEERKQMSLNSRLIAEQRFDVRDVIHTYEVVVS